MRSALWQVHLWTGIDSSDHQTSSDSAACVSQLARLPDRNRSPIIARLLPQLFSLTRRSRNQIAEMIQIVERFEAAGVEPIALKGAVLSKLAFGDPAMRTCVDLDLLVSAARVSEVDRLMREAHYKRIAPAGSLTPAAP